MEKVDENELIERIYLYEFYENLYFFGNTIIISINVCIGCTHKIFHILVRK